MFSKMWLDISVISEQMGMIVLEAYQAIIPHAVHNPGVARNNAWPIYCAILPLIRLATVRVQVL